jgi:asparagine synthase (glutamine-hydrolysing)
VCGIAGVIGADAALLCRRMTSALVHRGPDDDGYLEADGLALGFRRLSIIDLEGGRQPISNETGDVHLICNGEIYNSPELRRRLMHAGHRFRTKTDVEVILHLYEDHGEDCVRYLRGMFAFAVWDARNHSLLLAKDHMGQKPLFFAEAGGHFLFASEIQALLASDVIQRRVDVEGLWNYLSLRSFPDQLSLIDGVRKLPAATTLSRSANGSLSARRYWNPDFRSKMTFNEDEAVDALEERLKATVKSHELSDVTVGAFLSGGIDSTVIAAMMARDRGKPLPVFSIGVEETSFDELPVARAVADSNNMQFFGERVHADVASLIPMMVHHLGEPADPYAMGIYLVSKLASGHVKVALSGDGGDESFAGYDRYLGQKLVDIYCLFPETIRKRVLGPLITTVPETHRYKSLAQRLSWLQSMSEFKAGERYARALGVLRFTPETKHKLMSAEAVAGLKDVDSEEKVLRYFNADNVEDLLDRMLYTDLMTRVPDHNLVMTDRMSMACSLEVRSPFVDPDVVEFAARLPVQFKLKGRRLKYLLRKVAERYIPRGVARLPKQGFGFPVGIWMKRDLGPLLRRRLGQSRMAQAGIFNQPYIDSLCAQHMSGKVDHSYRLWLLLCLEFWYDIHVEQADVASLQHEARAAIDSSS